MLHTVATGAVRRRERILPATEPPDQPASGVEDVEPHVLVLVLEPVIDHRAARRVLPYGVRVRPTAAEAAPPIHAVRVARLEEVQALPRDRARQLPQRGDVVQDPERASVRRRSEEHTSELQSQSNLVCRLLLEKKKKRGYWVDGETGGVTCGSGSDTRSCTST